MGRIAPFFRNVAQFVFVGLMMYFLATSNMILNALKLIETGEFKALLEAESKLDLFTYAIAPAAQLLLYIWTIVLLKHATGNAEYRNWMWDNNHEFNQYVNDDGTSTIGWEAKGRATFPVFSVLTLLTAGGLFGGMWYFAGNGAASMATLYIAVVALAAILEEAFMHRLPNVKGKVAALEGTVKNTEEDDYDVDWSKVNNTGASATSPATQYAPETYYQPTMQNLDSGIYIQPNGKPVMVLRKVGDIKMLPHQGFEQAGVLTQNGNSYMVMPMDEQVLQQPMSAYDEKKNVA
jgi:hypothetical protein